MKTWKSIKDFPIPINTCVAVRAKGGPNGRQHAIVELGEDGKLRMDGGIALFTEFTPTEWVDLPTGLTSDEKWCSQAFPLIWANVQEIQRAEDRRKQAVSLIFNLFTILEGNRCCHGLKLIYGGRDIGGNIHGLWIDWVKENHPEEMP